jgi:2-keto-4-pentenoate hydratase/2-oxohepta-3-ene-1,7-dioic acid hydratase in catechol pathway
MQDSSTAEMIFGVGAILSFASHSFTLEPGDLVLTGTPAGVGAYRSPPRFLGAGDQVEVEVGGIGVLANPVDGPLGGAWRSQAEVDGQWPSGAC